jgi:hypothetical protein
VQLTANVFALRKLLHAIENHTPFLFIDNLQVRTQVAPNHRASPGEEPQMYVQFEASGYAPSGS